MSVIRLRTSTIARKCEVHDILLERRTSLRFTLEDIHTLRSGVCVHVSVTYRELVALQHQHVMSLKAKTLNLRKSYLHFTHIFLL